LASGRFNNDSYTDLAVGIPYRSSGNIGAGMVKVFYGTSGGLSASGEQSWEQGFNLPDATETGDAFGRALAAGDFSGDGIDDLAIGVPLEDFSSKADAGIVHIVLGTSTGLTSTGNETWHLDVSGVTSVALAGDEFGHALASGHFDDDVYADLAVGLPGHSGSGNAGAGMVKVLFGVATGLTEVGDQSWEQGFNLPDTTEPGDAFGKSLAVADFNGDTIDDLAIGVPQEDFGAVANAGVVHVVYGTSSGLTTPGNQLWSQDDPQVSDALDANDLFASALAGGDFDGDGSDDFAVGVPAEDGVGAVNVIYGYGPCGNGLLQPGFGEVCDDGNITNEDGCSDVCAVEICGDGILQPPLAEECDDGGNIDGDGCSSICIDEFCGDGIVNDVVEECDDGGVADGDGCSGVCIDEFCGDGIVNDVVETCDDGNAAGGDGCAAACWIESDVLDLFGTSMGGSVSITVEGVLITITTFPGQTSAEILAALAAAILADPTLSGLGIQVAIVGDRLYVSGAATAYTLNDQGLSETAPTAVTVAHTDAAAFAAALAGPATTEDFDALADGDPVGMLGDLDFSTSAPVEAPLATEAFDTASAPVSLGIDNLDEALLDGDPLAIVLAQSADAIGLRIVTSDPALQDEMILVTPVGAAANAALVESSAPDGGYVYFVGLVSDTPFSSAVLGFEQDAATNFVYTVDDVTLHFVPEPGFLVSLGAGIAFLACAQRRRQSLLRQPSRRSK
jgi:cysteine-rich repeat protein